MKDLEWLVVFDFDGVLVDPLDAAISAATQAYNELNSADYKFEFFRKKFGNSTHLIRTGRDVMPLMNLIADGKDTVKMAREEINEYKKGLGEEKVQWLEGEYCKRKEERRGDIGKWLSTIGEHKEAIDAFKKIRAKLETWIVTTRDKDSILLFFKNRGLGLDAGKIIDGRYSHDKGSQFELLREKTGIPFEKMLFFEDTLFNSLTVKKLGVHVFISTWGFSKEEQWPAAEREDIKPITQDEILSSVEEITGVKF